MSFVMTPLFDKSSKYSDVSIRTNFSQCERVAIFQQSCIDANFCWITVSEKQFMYEFHLRPGGPMVQW